MKGRAIVVGRIQKFNGNQILVSVKHSDSGEALLDVREHFQNDGIMVPMKAGITVGIARAKLISEAIEKAVMIAGGEDAKAT